MTVIFAVEDKAHVAGHARDRSEAGGRPRAVDLREVINAIFYLNRSGCAWRMLPHELRPGGTVHYSARQWRLNGVWNRTWRRCESRRAARRLPVPLFLIARRSKPQKTGPSGLRCRQKSDWTQASPGGGYARVAVGEAQRSFLPAAVDPGRRWLWRPAGRVDANLCRRDAQYCEAD